MLQNSYSDIEMKICSADPNTNHDSMTTMMTVIFVIDVLQQKPGTCHHHHFELGGGLPADKGHSQTTLTIFFPLLTPTYHQDDICDVLYCYMKNMHTIDISSSTYLPRLVNVVCESPLN